MTGSEDFVLRTLGATGWFGTGVTSSSTLLKKITQVTLCNVGCGNLKIIYEVTAIAQVGDDVRESHRQRGDRIWKSV